MAKRSRAWVFTKQEHDNAPEYDEKKHKYLLYGKETAPTTGKEHLQGYVVFKHPQRLKTLKKWLPGAHLEVAKGSAQQNYTYCTKEGDFVEFGTLPKQGKRTDVEKLVELAKQRKRPREAWEEEPVAYFKFHKHYRHVFNMELYKETKDFRHVKVIVLWGPLGFGKSRIAHEADPHLYTLFSEKPLWFDGYCGEKTLLIDDFCGGIEYLQLLRLLDGYRMQCPVKGGSTWACWDTVYITSNTPPDAWYIEYSALQRRLTEIIKVG